MSLSTSTASQDPIIIVKCRDKLQQQFHSYEAAIAYIRDRIREDDEMRLKEALLKDLVANLPVVVAMQKEVEDLRKKVAELKQNLKQTLDLSSD